MINGVLTERTVKEVVPILKTNSDGLKKALEELVKQYKSKQDEMEKWKVRLSPCLSGQGTDHCALKLDAPTTWVHLSSAWTLDSYADCVT